MSKLILKIATYITKALYFESKIAATNSFFLISLTLLVAENIFPIV